MESPAEYLNTRAALPPLQVLLDERVLDVPDHLLDLLPVGVYVCDRAGLIVRYNRAAAELWGCSPKIGDPTARFCGSYRLYGLNGDLIPHAKCPMGDVLATGEGLRDQEIVIERPERRARCGARQHCSDQGQRRPRGRSGERLPREP